MSEKIERINSLILQTPPGEIQEVINDLKSVVDESLISSGCMESLIKLNNETMVEAKINDGKPNALITKYGQDKTDNTKYYDHTNKLVITFNHMKCKKESQKPFTIDDSIEISRILIENCLKTYLKQFYEKFNFAVYGFEDKKRAFVICTENHLFTPKNFWNGQIHSRFKVDMSSSSSMVIKGKLVTKIHYYEDGNVQMFSENKVQTTIPMGEPDKNSKEIVNFIQREESKYQNSQLSKLSDMMESTFKALRRQLPITRTKVDWANIAGYGIGKNIPQPK